MCIRDRFHVNRSGIVVDMIPRNTYDPATVQTMREELTQSMQAALSCIDPNMTATEKVVQVHNYLALTCAYDYENYQTDTIPRSSYTAYGALVSRRAAVSYTHLDVYKRQAQYRLGHGRPPADRNPAGAARMRYFCLAEQR